MNDSRQRFHLVEGGQIGELHEQIQRLTDINAKLVRANTSMGAELAGAMHTIRKLGAEIAALKGEHTKAFKRQAESERITALLETWRDCLGHRRANIDLDGKRADVVRKAFRRGHTRPPIDCPIHDQPGPVKDAVCTVWDELTEAIRGLALRPYVVNYRRARIGAASQRYDKVENALGDEERVEKFRGYWLAAKAAPARLVWAEKERVEAQLELLRTLTFGLATNDRFLIESIPVAVRAGFDDGGAA